MAIARAVRPFFAAAVLSLVSALPASAQLEVGTWVRTSASAASVRMTMKIEAWNGSGRRLTYVGGGGKTKFTLTLDTRLDGSDSQVIADGKPTGETMAIKRMDAHHATTVIRMNGKPFATSTASLSADGKTLTVVTDNTSAVGGAVGKQTEVYVKQ